MVISTRLSLITIIWTLILGGVTFTTLSGQVFVQAKTKSYQLIVYLNNAFQPNHMPSFKVVIYNSDRKEIVSDTIRPDFTKNRQKISPNSGYEILDNAKQHPNEITVCAQETYSENGQTKTHDDCFPIQHDKGIRWSTIFDYPLIEEFEVNEDEGA